MDVKSPVAAGSPSRPSSALPAPPEPSRVAVALRRAGIALTGVGVAGLTAAACVLSFEDLRGLAVTGEAAPGLAYLYPAAFDALFTVALVGVMLLRGGRWPARLQAGVILALLFVAAAAAEVATAVRATVDVRQAAVVVAVAPWVMLAVALWLWLLLIKHAATRRAAADARQAGRDHDIVPFPDAEPPTAEPLAAEPLAAEPPAQPTRSAQPVQPPRPVEPVHHSPVEVVLDPQAAPPLESVPHHDLPAPTPVTGPTPAPETPQVSELPGTPDTAEPVKPVRWGDLLRPPQGDVLVHPPRGAIRDKPRGAVRDKEPGSRTGERARPQDTDGDGQEAQEEQPQAGTDDRDADTQPMHVVSGGSSPDPAHGAEAADPEESAAEAADPEENAAEAADPGKSAAEAVAPPEPHEEDREEELLAPPSGRVRSTPTPPEE
ncbi:hypothetical protein [Streptosporangium sp. NPDC000396]|uniref:hypothetical protein n=1 Tax=Streptosporangium sp. NPDC000396 TaxID=3366185 RepID=UPI0036C78223